MKKSLSVRWPLVVAAVFSLGILACGPSASTSTAPQIAGEFDDLPRTEGRPAILLATPLAPAAHELWQSLRNELGDEFDLVTLEVEQELTAEKLRRSIHSTSPDCVVLVGNRATRLFRTVQRTGEKTPPAMVLMSSFAEELVQGLHSTTGIAYEVPGVTSMVRTRALFEGDLKRVGVLHRPALKKFVDQQAELAKIEEFEVVSVELDQEASVRELRLGLRSLLNEKDVDALWVLNDNSLLTPAAIRDGWLKETKRSRVPVVVGVDALVNSELGFGSVAIVPDHEALGVQAANLLFDLADNDWEIEEPPVAFPLSIQTIVDMRQTGVFPLRPDAERLIDRTVE